MRHRRAISLRRAAIIPLAPRRAPCFRAECREHGAESHAGSQLAITGRTRGTGRHGKKTKSSAKTKRRATASDKQQSARPNTPTSS